MMLNDFEISNTQKQTIQSYAEKNSFPQTLLVEGRDEETRLEFAKLVANMIICQSETGKPCLECGACKKFISGSHPDVKIYSGEKPNSIFKVELCREIKADAFVIPNDGDKKVYILLESQNMNEAAENALLKILEEPPQFDYFILTCDSRSAMLPTILSRATSINLGEAKTEYDESIILTASQIAVSVCQESEIDLLEALAKLATDKNSFISTCNCLKEIFVQCLINKETHNNNSQFAKTVETICLKLTAQRIYAVINTISELYNMFKMNANYNLLITSMSCKLRQAVGK